MTTYYLKTTSTTLESIPNDVAIEINAYLADSENRPFVNPNTNAVDLFTIQLLKSSLPASGYASYLSIISRKYIGEKYNKTLGGTTRAGSNIVSGITTTAGLVAGLLVKGDNLQVDSTLTALRDKTSVQVSKTATTSGDITLNFVSSGWTIDYSELDRIVSIIDFSTL